MGFFDYCTGSTMTNGRFDALFGGPARKPESKLTQREMDLAASVQAITEEIVLKLARDIRKTTRQKNLCLAGGVALNCVANGKLLREKVFDDIWIQPAAGDSGGAVGAALAACHLMLHKPRCRVLGDSMRGAYLGPEFSQREIEERLNAIGAVFVTTSDDVLIDSVAHALMDG
jgi:carbamoyltransferase